MTKGFVMRRLDRSYKYLTIASFADCQVIVNVRRLSINTGSEKFCCQSQLPL